MQVTTATRKIAGLQKRVKVVQGGQGAGKTFGIIHLLTNHAFDQPARLITVIAESIPKLKRGAIRDFKFIMAACGAWERERWNTTESRYEFPNGSVMEFVSGDKSDKFRGARRTDAFFNEAESISFDLYNQVTARTSGNVFVDYNPSHEFWVHTDVVGTNDADFLILTYLDNEAIPEAEKKYIEDKKERAKTSQYWANWYTVYGEGQIGTLEGVVFKEFQQVNITPDVWNGCKWIAYGLDFGYTADPAALIKVGYYDGAIWLEEMFYETGLTNQDIGNKMRSLGNAEIIADSAEPKSIEEIRRMNYIIQPSVKGQDSVRYGIDIMRQYPINVSAESVNLIKELRNYVWQIKDGKNMNKPIDAYNHGIDAARYVCSIKLGTPQDSWHKHL